MVPIDEGRELKIEYVFRANTRPWFLKVLYKESTLQFPGTFKDAMASWANNREYPGYIRQSHLQTYFILFVFQKNMNWCNFSDNTDPNCEGFIVKIAKQYVLVWWGYWSSIKSKGRFSDILTYWFGPKSTRPVHILVSRKLGFSLPPLRRSIVLTLFPWIWHYSLFDIDRPVISKETTK